MDIQHVSGGQGDAAQTAAYIAAYVSKGETEGLQRAAAEGLASMPPQSTERQLLRRIGTTHLAARETSLQVRHGGLCMWGHGGLQAEGWLPCPWFVCGQGAMRMWGVCWWRLWCSKASCMALGDAQ